MWRLKLFSIYTLYSQEKSYFFNVVFETLSYIYIRKKLYFYNME